MSVRSFIYAPPKATAPLGLCQCMTYCSGASYGQWRMPWAPEEREDSVEIIEWITRQTWSNGQVYLPSLYQIVASVSQQRGCPPGACRYAPPSTYTGNPKCRWCCRECPMRLPQRCSPSANTLQLSRAAWHSILSGKPPCFTTCLFTPGLSHYCDVCHYLG
jgi:hypothetical protein